MNFKRIAEKSHKHNKTNDLAKMQRFTIHDKNKKMYNDRQHTSDINQMKNEIHVQLTFLPTAKQPI